jgi:transposase-like protein
MINSLPRCDQCNSPVTDSIEMEIENHGRVKMGKNIQDSWICNDCMANRTVEATSTIQDDSNVAYIMNTLESQTNLMYLPILQSQKMI